MTEAAETATQDAGEVKKGLEWGCLVALALLLVGIGGLMRGCFLSTDHDMNTVVIPGKTWKLAVTSNIETVGGLGRLDDIRATLTFDGAHESISLAATGRPQSTWGPGTDISIISVKGIPVADGQEDIELAFDVEVPDEPEWIGRTGDLRVQARLVYPTFDFDQAVVGAHTGSIQIEEKTYDYDATFHATIQAGNPEYVAAKRRARQLDFAFLVLLLLAIVVGIVTVVRLPQPEVEPEPSSEVEGA